MESTYNLKNFDKAIIGSSFVVILLSAFLVSMLVFPPQQVFGGNELIVTISPQNIELAVNQHQMFTVNVSGGVEPYFFTWKSNGTILDGSQTVDFWFNEPADFVDLWVEVKDSSGLFEVAHTVVRDPFSARSIYLEDLPSSVAFVVDSDGSYFWATRDDGYIVYNSTTDDDAIQYALNQTESSGGTVTVKAGSYSASVTLKDNTTLILEKNARTITVSIDSGADATLWDMHNNVIKEWESGSLTFHYDSGEVLVSNSFTTTTIYLADMISNSSAGTTWSAYRMRVENGSTCPSPTQEGHVFFNNDQDTLCCYNGTNWINMTTDEVITDHGSMSGLGDDDHTIYVLNNGSRSLTGDWNVGSHGIYGLTTLNATTLYVGTIDAVSDFVQIYKQLFESGTEHPTSKNTGYVYFRTDWDILTVYNGTHWLNQTVAGITDHGEFTGLSDDDHPIYILTNGSRALTGTWDVGSQSIIGVAWFNATSMKFTGELWYGSSNRTDIIAFPDAPEKYLVTSDGTTAKWYNCSTGQIVEQGTDQIQIIQYAMDNLTSGRTNPEKVILTGTYDNVASAVNVSSYTEVEGPAQFNPASGYSGNVIQNAHQDSYDGIVWIHGITIIGQGDHPSGAGIYWNNTQNPANYALGFLKISDITIHATYNGICTDFTNSSNTYAHIENVMVGFACDNYGFYAKNFEGLISGSHFGGNGGGMFFDSGGSLIVDTCYINSGATLQTTVAPQFDNCIFDNVGLYDGLQLKGARWGQFTNIKMHVFDSHGYSSATAINLTDYSSFYCYNNTFSNVYIGRAAFSLGTNVWGTGIAENGNSDYNTYSLIDTRDCGTNGILLVGSNSKVTDYWNLTDWIPDYNTLVDYGFETNVDDGDSIAHNLGVTPDYVFLTVESTKAKGSGGYPITIYWNQTATNSTHFGVNIYEADAGAETGVSFSWMAIKEQP